MLSSLWFTFLYQPLFNVLIYIYNTFGAENLGWSVVLLTMGLRIVLLPLSIISERSKAGREKAMQLASEVAQVYKNDPVARNQEVRKFLRQHRISPWAAVIVIIIQVITFIVLYQVFVGGITGEKMARNLYIGVDFPGTLNTDFYGFDIGMRRDTLWAGIVAAYVFITTFIEHKARGWKKSDVVFLIFFPLSIFIFLWVLPMVKSLFLLTTLVFSDILSLGHTVFFPPKKPAAHH